MNRIYSCVTGLAREGHRWLKTVLPPLVWRSVPEEIRAKVLRRIVKDVRKRASSNNGPSVFFPPAIPWHRPAFQRHHQMARALSELGCSVFYHDPMDPVASNNPVAQDKRWQMGVEDITKTLHLLRCPRFVLRDIAARAKVNLQFMSWPRHAAAIADKTSTFVVYDICDDNALAGRTANAEFIRIQQKWVAAADVIVVTADRLLETVRPRRPDVILLPNAVRPEDWQMAEPPPIPSDMEQARRAPVVVGYFGTVGRWFDWDMWENAARTKADWAFVLIGGPYDVQGRGYLERVKAVANIHYLGRKPYCQLKDYLWHFDVATIPFLLSAITSACSPVKLFEYMAGGKPIVATRMHEVMKYKSVVLAEDAPGFVHKIEDALTRSKDPAYKALLRAEAAENTWFSRASMLLQVIERTREQQGRIPRRHPLRARQRGI